MSYAPHKLVPAGFTPTPALASLTRVTAATTVPDAVDAVAFIVTSDGDLPSDVAASRDDLAAAGFKAEAGTSIVLARAGSPLVVVRRRSDGVRGSLMFQHNPRFYFSFTPG